MYAAWLYKTHADYENGFEGFVDYYQDQCVRALANKFPGITRDIIRCICFAYLEGESYALSLFEKAFLEKKHAVCLLEINDEIEKEMVKEYEDERE